MTQVARPFLLVLAFLVGGWACQEPSKPPEKRTTSQNLPQKKPAPEKSLAAPDRSVRTDEDSRFKNQLQEELIKKLMADFGLTEEDARATAKAAIPPGRSLEDIYPPDAIPLWDKTPEELKAEFREQLKNSGLPPEAIESEVNAIVGRLFEPPKLPPNLTPEKLREAMESAGLPPDAIDSEIARIFGGPASPQPPAKPDLTTKRPQ